MKEKGNGFTLIELLAVIVILAIIALIAVPVVMNIIAKANKSAFKDSGYGIIKAGELYYTEKLLDVDGMTEDVTFTFPEATGLELKGTKPVSGNMIVTKDGKVAIAISNGKYCVRRGYDDADVTIDENIDDCSLAGGLTVTLNPNISSENECIKNTNMICPNGTPVNVQVNDTKNYKFYVINDIGSKMTLIMNNYIGELGQIGAYNLTSDPVGDGIKKVLDLLDTYTSDWSNIPVFTYTVTDDGGGSKYESFERSSRGRLITYTEAQNLGCTGASGSCPTWLYENLTDSNDRFCDYYWTSGVSSTSTIDAWTIECGGSLEEKMLSDPGVPVIFEEGYYDEIRPVITISKTL